MASFDYKRLRSEAADALNAASYSPKKLILIHTGIALGLGLLINVLHHALGLGIAQTGGLGGIGTRTVLETIQSILQIVNLVTLPFWQIGFIFVILKLARRQDATPASLLQGFRNWGGVLRTKILQSILYFGAIMLGSQMASTIYLITPAAQPLYKLTQELAEAGVTDPYALLENEAYLSVMMGMMPFLLIGAAVFVIPLFYRLRFMDYVIMDHPDKGAFHAMARSMQMTRRNGWKLFKLDLRFWWYFLLELLIAVLCYGDTLLPMMGIELGMQEDTAMFAFYLAALVFQFGLYVWQKNGVFATYALVYEEIRIPPQYVSRQATKPTGKMPWNY